MATLNFDATQWDPSGSYDLLPEGWYVASIDESELKPTKDGAGVYLALRYNILEQPYANQKLFQRLNIKNANPVAEQIAFKALSAIAHAVGVLHVQDSMQLHGVPLKVKVKVKKDPSGRYDDANEVVGVRKEDGDTGVTAPQAPPQTMQAPAQRQAPAPVAPAPAPVAPAPVAPAPAQRQAPAPAPVAPAQPWAQAPAQAPVAPPWAQAPAQAPAQAAAQAPQAPAQTAPHPTQSAVPPWAQ